MIIFNSNKLATLLSALAHPARLEIVRATGEMGSVTAALFPPIIDASRQDIHRHLTILINTGVLTSHGQGRNRTYSLTDPGLASMLEGLDHLTR